MRGGVALLILLAATGLQAEPLGRLFFSPAERISINRHEAATARPPAPPPRLDGFIVRSAGTPTLFLDGQATPARPGQIRISDASARVTGADGRQHRLRVGAPSPAEQ